MSALNDLKQERESLLNWKKRAFLIKTEDYTSEVGYSERTDAVVEPGLSLQWWVSMKPLSTTGQSGNE